MEVGRWLVGFSRLFCRGWAVLFPVKRVPERLSGALRRRPGEGGSPGRRRCCMGRAFPGRGRRYAPSSKGGLTSERILWVWPSSAAPSASAIITAIARPMRAFIFACPRMK